MTYLLDSELEEDVFRTMVRQAIVKAIVPLVNKPTPNAIEKIADAIAGGQLDTAVEWAFRKMRVVDGLNASSADSDIDGALVSPDSLDLLTEALGLGLP